MGWFKEKELAQQESDELADNIELLLGDDGLGRDTPAYGIAKQIADKGLESLSDKQYKIYEMIISPALEKMAMRHDYERSVSKSD